MGKADKEQSRSSVGDSIGGAIGGAIDGALGASDPGDWQEVIAGGVVLRVFVQGHDYGPLFERGGALARFPELELIVEVEEL